ncbi:nucleoside triphosphate pyrophosphohydrolase [Desulfobaculum bizertense]|uniref:ATP diphosphatase n=1 Tax=Desulfobaculum bizertense DSM 18034 TaxID=1121442 RepID=A0A1T4WC38_9BACT|nr:nucleoside triphosphate pyrophosphohydrolase [Desulfobaculum bizertense]UIJ37435.1 nucleoside triphosphate pyrophosphohydrolase [Desulfobaculum bizertense]SKA74853.1 ATP diphosphatase [Desulfobaculum bizertense DSM 18034]
MANSTNEQGGAEASADALKELDRVTDALLGEGGCPWDIEQTPWTMTDYILEEAFELVEAIRADAPEHSTEESRSEVMEELGDVAFLLQFVAKKYSQAEHFSLADSLKYAAAKMVRRHPHVFGDLHLNSEDELLSNWEKIKRAERSEDGEAPKRVFASLPKGLPPMLKAYRINSKAARAGFTWDSDDAQEAHLQSEWQEWKEAEASGDEEKMQEEFGDYLFSLVEYGRRRGLKASMALGDANVKFLRRFNHIEDVAREKGQDITELSLDEMNALWDETKKK